MSDWFSGVDKVVQASGKVKQRKAKGAKRGVLLALRNVLNVSNAQVPHEEGDLERDGGYGIDGELLRGAVTYGRSADTKDYAEVQHEDMTLNHDSGRNAKFLENAFNSTRAQSRELIAESVKGEFNG